MRIPCSGPSLFELERAWRIDRASEVAAEAYLVGLIAEGKVTRVEAALAARLYCLENAVNNGLPLGSLYPVPASYALEMFDRLVTAWGVSLTAFGSASGRPGGAVGGSADPRE